MRQIGKDYLTIVAPLTVFSIYSLICDEHVSLSNSGHLAFISLILMAFSVNLIVMRYLRLKGDRKRMGFVIFLLTNVITGIVPSILLLWKMQVSPTGLALVLQLPLFLYASYRFTINSLSARLLAAG